jgi:cobalt-precorrin-5B (C1)-methyltransferase
MNAKQRHGKLLRKGYTTGTCAAAASKAAALALLAQQLIKEVEISLPGGETVAFAIHRCDFDIDQATCSVIKDAGDDPDITDGIEICATVTFVETPGIFLTGGKGVGRVTKPGLDIPVGKSAINPVPEKMIVASVAEAVADAGIHRGVKVTISVPRGEELSKRTLNSRLGIVEGISIIGTSGIVIPYSVKAYTACISKALDVAAACGCREVVFTTGRRSEKYAQGALHLQEEAFILAGDYIGYSLKETARKGICKATVWGMIGKISKLAAGHLYTNVSDSFIDISLLTTVAEECHLSGDVVAVLRQSVTANHFRKLLPPHATEEFCARLCVLAAKKCSAAVKDRVMVECVITDPVGVILGRSDAKG